MRFAVIFPLEPPMRIILLPAPEGDVIATGQIPSRGEVRLLGMYRLP
jgi:hypothetical protein